jgi:threonine/homoserine/homoserine lactone efflux protein
MEQPLSAFVVVALVMELTPGPNMAYLALVSAGQGRKAGLLAVVGVTLGLLTYLIAAVLGLAEVALRWPAVYQALRWLGVGYLLWMAWDAWREAGAPATGAPDPASARTLVLRGYLANVLNPKAAMLYVALLPGFMSGRNPAMEALGLGAIHLGISLMVHLSIVVAGGQAAALLDNGPASRRRRVERGFAVALALVAIWLAWGTRTA